jgi:hypothetical protein
MEARGLSAPSRSPEDIWGQIEAKGAVQKPDARRRQPRSNAHASVALVANALHAIRFPKGMHRPEKFAQQLISRSAP